MPPLLQLEKLPGKGDGRRGKKCLCVVFLLTRISRVRGGGGGGGGGMHFGASYSTSNKLLLVARQIPTTGLQKCLESWQCKIRKFTVTSFHCEESTHRK